MAANANEDLAGQAYVLARNLAAREQAFAEVMRSATARDDGGKAFRDAADGAIWLYSVLAGRIEALGSAEPVMEMVAQQPPAAARLVPLGIAAKLGPEAEAFRTGEFPPDATSAAARAAYAVAAPAMPALDPSPAVSSPAGGTPGAPGAVRQAQVDRIVEAAGREVRSDPSPEYAEKVRNLRTIAENMLAAGTDEAQVAEIVSWRRRELEQTRRERMPEPLQRYVQAVNQSRFGDPMGPACPALRGLLLTDREIIDRAGRLSRNAGKFLEGFRKWLEGMPDEDIAGWADRPGGPA
jgi:hypothetical protein